MPYRVSFCGVGSHILLIDGAWLRRRDTLAQAGGECDELWCVYMYGELSEQHDAWAYTVVLAIGAVAAVLVAIGVHFLALRKKRYWVPV